MTEGGLPEVEYMSPSLDTKKKRCLGKQTASLTDFYAHSCSQPLNPKPSQPQARNPKHEPAGNRERYTRQLAIESREILAEKRFRGLGFRVCSTVSLQSYCSVSKSAGFGA